MIQKWKNGSEHSTQQITEDRCHAFLHALLSTTLSSLTEICKDKDVALKRQPDARLAILASESRDRMASGRTFDAHGDYRTKFYDAVFAKATEVMSSSFPRIQFLMSRSECGGHHPTFHPYQKRHRRQSSHYRSRATCRNLHYRRGCARYNHAPGSKTVVSPCSHMLG